MPREFIQVEGLANLQRVFAKAGPQASIELREELKVLADPVRLQAERFALGNISHIGKSWWRMRVGVTRGLVYVAPTNRGVNSRRNDKLRRPKFANTMMDKAMTPALEANRAKIDGRVNSLFEELAAEWTAS